MHKVGQLFNIAAERLPLLNSNGVYMTKEDYDFFLDGDCSAGEHVTTRISLHDMIVEHANNFANGETDNFNDRCRAWARKPRVCLRQEGSLRLAFGRKKCTRAERGKQKRG